MRFDILKDLFALRTHYTFNFDDHVNGFEGIITCNLSSIVL